MYNIKNGLDYQKKRAKRKDTSDEKFLTAVVNFLIMALIVFCIVKAMNAAGERFGHKEEKAPDTKECPYCKSKIADRKSTRLNSSHTDSSRMPSSA